jgi:hypothetical protein
MVQNIRLRSRITLFSLLVPTAFLFAQNITVKNAGFEDSGQEGLPAAWAVGSTKGAHVSVSVDAALQRSGKQSVALEAKTPGRIVLQSSPVTLEIGHLYRLTGWVRSENLAGDPTTRYPTSVPATLTMTSFPFTNSAPSTGGTGDWREVRVVFIATQAEDHIELHLGYNGDATGKVWFDDMSVREVDDVGEYIPVETIKWYGPAFRYTDRGWTFIHIEGEPYQRGYQYGTLMAKEIGQYIDKLAIRQNADNARAGWNELRTLADALMLRKYDEEYLVEMRGIADGAARGGATFAGKSLDFLDVVTLNSAVDLGQLGSALAKTATPLTGRSFRVDEEEQNAVERLHKCSSFLANGPATKDGRIVFGQLFMWGGYTGVHWDVICDVVPSQGRRLVYETFPGGIHSGTDFYINDAGIMIGETTVMQTPFDAEGEPQSSRIRKAAQYGKSIDDVVRILTENNNGLYTNDWLIGDTKSDEIAILLLGTKKHKLWRSKKGDFPGGTEGFLWSDNNAKDPEVRKEYVPDPTNAPFDVVFSPVNRDLEFMDFYKRDKGRMDAISAVNMLATSPINRPHACDGKVTTSAMAEKMVFLAHYGKVTQREKWVEKNSRLMPDLPNAIPHLSLGYSVFSPVFIADKIKQMKRPAPLPVARPRDVVVTDAKEVFQYQKKHLWTNTVYPANEGDNWFVSGTAAYWQILNGLPADQAQAINTLTGQLTEMSTRLQYVIEREGSMVPTQASRAYDHFGDYLIPRLRGTFALHQLRLLLGNYAFSQVMNAVHEQFRNRTMTSGDFIEKAEEVARKPLAAFVRQWIDRGDLPAVAATANVAPTDSGTFVTLDVVQEGNPYDFFATVAVETAGEVQWKVVECTQARQKFSFPLKGKPVKVTFNAAGDIPVARANFYTFSNFFDDFSKTTIVYGTSRQIEANHSLALKFQTVLADQFTENLPPVVQDNAVSDSVLASSDLILLGGIADNSLLTRVLNRLGLSLEKNLFRWKEKTFADPDDGLFAVYPNPFNTRRVVYLFIGNSALELYQMTRRWTPLPSWAIFKGDQVVDRGYHGAEHCEVELR